MFTKVNKFLNNLYSYSGYIAALFLILVAVFILIGISSRIFGFYIRGLAEYSGYCMAASSFFALSKSLDQILSSLGFLTSINASNCNLACAPAPIIPIFDNIKNFDSLTAITKDGISWGYCNDEVELVLPYKYTYLESYHKNYALAKKGDFYGFINSRDTCLLPFIFSSIEKINASKFRLD